MMQSERPPIFLSPFPLTVKVPAPSDLRVTNFSGNDITVRWDPAASDVLSYLIKWISLSGGELSQVGRLWITIYLKCFEIMLQTISP